MGLLDFLFAGAVINSMKKALHNSPQPSHGRTYDHVYEAGYVDSYHDHGCHDDDDCHDTYDCDSYDNDCENDGDW